MQRGEGRLHCTYTPVRVRLGVGVPLLDTAGGCACMLRGGHRHTHTHLALRASVHASVFAALEFGFATVQPAAAQQHAVDIGADGSSPPSEQSGIC